MNNFASIIPPGQPIPDPPEIKWITMLIGIACSLAVVSVIAFIAIEFTMDLLGKPLQFGDMPRPDAVETGPKAQGKKEVDVDQVLSEYRLLSPIDRSRISGRVPVLCTWHSDPGSHGRQPPIPLRLYVDEFLVPWDIQFGSNTWIARLRLSPGRHRLRTSVFEAEIDVTDDYETGNKVGPNDWPKFRMHPDIDNLNRCGDCHYWIERSDDVIRRGHGITIGPWKGPSSCLSCHPAPDFEDSHRHRFAPLEDCRLCHAPHGTAVVEKTLLRDTPKKLCSQCHDSPD